MTAVFEELVVGLVVVVTCAPFSKNKVLINGKFVLTLLLIIGNA